MVIHDVFYVWAMHAYASVCGCEAGTDAQEDETDPQEILLRVGP